MTGVAVTRTYLEMTDPGDLHPAEAPDEGVKVERVPDPSPSLYRHLYSQVGGAYSWVDRLGWTDERIRRHFQGSRVSLFVMTVDGTLAGYFELVGYDDGSSEIAYFGLLPGFKGRGLGKHLLTIAVREAWRTARRVWLHTCTLDDSAALPNYLRRGFRPFRQETYLFEPPAANP